MKPKIFISHISNDTEFARRLAADLEQANYEVFIYRDSIAPGESIIEKVSTAILDSDALILLLSHESSKNPWVSSEIALARAQREKGHGHKIIPIVIEEGIDIPFFIRDLLYLNMFSSDLYKQNLPRLLDSLDVSNYGVAKDNRGNVKRFHVKGHVKRVDVRRAQFARGEFVKAQRRSFLWEKELYARKAAEKQMLLAQQARFAGSALAFLAMFVSLALILTDVGWPTLISLSGTFLAGLVFALSYTARIRKKEIDSLSMLTKDLELMISKIQAGSEVSK